MFEAANSILFPLMGAKSPTEATPTQTFTADKNTNFAQFLDLDVLNK
jgi:hypothetical protein